MKKSLLLLLFAVVSMGSYAQFEQGTKYVGASLTGLNLSYSSGEKFGLGLQGTAGYFFADSWARLKLEEIKRENKQKVTFNQI